MNHQMSLATSLLALCIYCMFCSGVRGAVPITVFDTGVGASGTPLSDGTTGDPHYNLVAVPGGTTTTLVRTSAGGYPIGGYLGYWLGDDSASAWIGPDNNAQCYGPVGLFDYQTTFNLPFAGVAAITGRFASDDQLVSILFDGTNTGTPPGGTLSSWTQFNIQGIGNVGSNTLDFVVYNADAGFDQGSYMPGPNGLRVEILSASIPEPASAAIFLSSIFPLAISRGRRKAM